MYKTLTIKYTASTEKRAKKIEDLANEWLQKRL
jgi:hypothetical protein